jgi:hypothetical protein
MPNYTTADDPLAYDETGYYPGKKQPWYDTAAEIATFGIFDPNNKQATKRNKQITQAQTEQNLVRSKMNEVRNEVTKDIQAFANNLVQFTGMDKAEALKMATEHYQEPSVLAATIARNENIAKEAKGAAPFMADKGAADAEGHIIAQRATTSRNKGGLRRSDAANALGTPETQGLTDSTGAKGDLAKAQGGLATALDQNSTDELTRALKDPAAEQKYLRDQQLIKQLQAAAGVTGARMQGQQTKADAAALAGDIQSGAYDQNRRAALDRASTMILPQGGMAVRADGSRVENPMYFSTIRNTDADGNTKVAGIRGREYQGTADTVAQPIQSPADPGVIRIPRRSLLNPNQQ